MKSKILGLGECLLRFIEDQEVVSYVLKIEFETLAAKKWDFKPNVKKGMKRGREHFLDAFELGFAE